MHVTPIYAALLTMLFVFLSLRVIGVRRSARVALGDGGNATLQRRIRAHANFAEYVPLAIVLMALAELSKAPALALHILGAALVVGRLLHAYAVSQEPEPLIFRVIGMVMTFSVLLLGAALCLWRSLI